MLDLVRDLIKLQTIQFDEIKQRWTKLDEQSNAINEANVRLNSIEIQGKAALLKERMRTLESMRAEAKA